MPTPQPSPSAFVFRILAWRKDADLCLVETSRGWALAFSPTAGRRCLLLEEFSTREAGEAAFRELAKEVKP